MPEAIEGATREQLEELLVYQRRRETPAEPLPLLFDAAQGILEVDDASGMRPALSYGIYNPVKAKVYVAIMGGGASATSRAFSIPGRSFVILPVPIFDTVRVGIDAEELGEASATVWRFKYPFVHPTFAMLL